MLKLKAIEAPHNELLANELAAGGKAEVFVCTKADLDSAQPLGSGKFHLVRRPKFTMVSLDAACEIKEPAEASGDTLEVKATTFVAKTVDAKTDKRLFVKLTQTVTRTIKVFEGNPKVDLKLKGIKYPANDITVVAGPAGVTFSQAKDKDGNDLPGVVNVATTGDDSYHHGVMVLTVDATVDVGTLVAADPNVSHELTWAPGVSYLDAVAPLAGAPCTKLDRPVFTVRGANDHCAQCWKRMGDWSPIYIPFGKSAADSTTGGGGNGG